MTGGNIKSLLVMYQDANIICIIGDLFTGLQYAFHAILCQCYCTTVGKLLVEVLDHTVFMFT